MLEVSGRTYPVESRYRPLESDDPRPGTSCRRSRPPGRRRTVGHGRGDILYSYREERDIASGRGTTEAPPAGVEILRCTPGCTSARIHNQQQT